MHPNKLSNIAIHLSPNARVVAGEVVHALVAQGAMFVSFGIKDGSISIVTDIEHTKLDSILSAFQCGRKP